MRLGLIGGLGPESTIDYYRRLIDAWKAVTPGTAPNIVIDSVDVDHALSLVQNDRPALAEYLLASVRRLAAAGADVVALTANTPHIVFDEVARVSPVPMISIVETCAAEATRLKLRRPLLLGTRFTMEASFYPEVFARRGMKVMVPDESARQRVHEIYVGELLRGVFRDESRAEIISLANQLRTILLADCVILGGTELPLLLRAPTVASLPALDTTALHVAALVECLRSGKSAA